MEWISVKDELPPKEELVLVISECDSYPLNEHKHHKLYGLAKRIGFDDYSAYGIDEKHMGKITYWAKLPDLPDD